MFNCKKRAYKALAVQWDGENTEAVRALIPEAQPFRDALLLRHDKGVDSLVKGDWVVRGENGYVKTYNDATFKIKYEVDQ